MYVCICNGVTVSQYKNDPELRAKCGTNCGKCLEWIEENLIPGTPHRIFTEEKSCMNLPKNQ